MRSNKKKDPGPSSHSSWSLPQWKRGSKTEEGDASTSGGWWSRVVFSFGQFIRSIGATVGLDGNHEQNSETDDGSIPRIDDDNTAVIA